MIYPKFTPSRCLISITLTSLVVLLIFISSSNDRTTEELSPGRIFNNEIKPGRNYTPGDFVSYLYSEPSNESYCNFNYNVPKDFNYGTADVDFGPELGKQTSYRIVYNVLMAQMAEGVPEVTYATHVSADFMFYLPELVRYWDGFISITAFVPDLDVSHVIEQINQYCYCLPGMSRVSLHFVFDRFVAPSRKDVYFTKPSNCELIDSSKLKTYRHADDSVMYPINVCRNAARTASLTELVMVSDIQLMPSEGLAYKFLEMLDRYKLHDCERRVYVLPIFEVEAAENVPRTKTQLVEMVKEKKSVYFHKLVCRHCQKFPGIESWMRTDPKDTVKPLLTARREVPFHRWEPIYIGTKAEPLYNEKLSWEGLQDKMLQMLEMCLMEYKFVILDGAFLVHWPGMKKQKEDEPWRKPFVKQNSDEYKKILTNLLKKYNSKPQCKPQ
ncbi:beta-1,4-glucuronyltransferase 1-like [Diabrotica undecimpunctata]|uniref:beta-1,4-glucuronyltransferase 1-like n=1 Tax=Diabrotica undecimpunctata TaxID=50387 RepID=UPI003B63CAEF